MNVVRYHAQQKTAWNAFIAASKNGTFLLHRDYMEYHNDRFEDHSLCFVDNKGHLRAVLPATCHKVSLVSHGGLTYGGDYSTCFKANTLVTKAYVDAASGGILANNGLTRAGSYISLGGALTGDTTINGGNHDNCLIISCKELAIISKSVSLLSL